MLEGLGRDQFGKRCDACRLDIALDERRDGGMDLVPTQSQGLRRKRPRTGVCGKWIGPATPLQVIIHILAERSRQQCPVDPLGRAAKGGDRHRLERLVLDRTAGQRTRLIVMCEAGMVPQLASVAGPYGVTVISSGGFELVTEKHRLAIDMTDDGRPTEVLHIGDHDPSGAHLFLALAEDVKAFADELGGIVNFSRLAVTPGQIERLGLVTAPPKVSDRRAFTGETCQAEGSRPTS